MGREGAKERGRRGKGRGDFTDGGDGEPGWGKAKGGWGGGKVEGEKKGQEEWIFHRWIRCIIIIT